MPGGDDIHDEAELWFNADWGSGRMVCALLLVSLEPDDEDDDDDGSMS